MEIGLVVERCVTRFWKTSHQKRIAVGGCIHDRLGGNIGASTRPVLNHELLVEPLRQPLADQACHDVGATSGGKSDDDAHRPAWIGLRLWKTPQRRHGCGAPPPIEEMFGGG